MWGGWGGGSVQGTVVGRVARQAQPLGCLQLCAPSMVLERCRCAQWSRRSPTQLNAPSRPRCSLSWRALATTSAIIACVQGNAVATVSRARAQGRSSAANCAASQIQNPTRVALAMPALHACTCCPCPAGCPHPQVVGKVVAVHVGLPHANVVLHHNLLEHVHAQHAQRGLAPRKAAPLLACGRQRPVHGRERDHSNCKTAGREVRATACAHAPQQVRLLSAHPWAPAPRCPRRCRKCAPPRWAGSCAGGRSGLWRAQTWCGRARRRAGTTAMS